MIEIRKDFLEMTFEVSKNFRNMGIRRKYSKTMNQNIEVINGSICANYLLLNSYHVSSFCALGMYAKRHKTRPLLMISNGERVLHKNIVRGAEVVLGKHNSMDWPLVLFSLTQ